MFKSRSMLAFVYVVFALISGFNPIEAYATAVLSASPIVIKLIEVSSIKKGTLTVSWLPTTDDNTLHKQLLYQVYVSENEDFMADPATLKTMATGAVSAHIKDLKPGKRYVVLVTATDRDGNVSWSNLLAGRTVAIEAKRTKTAVHNVSVGKMQTAAAQGRVALRTAKPIAPGDYLVSREQGGYLRQITHTSQATNGETVADTAPAPLNEVFSDLSFNTTVKFQDIAAQPTKTSRMAVTAQSTGAAASVKWQDTGLTLSSSDPLPAKAAVNKTALTVNGDQQIQSGRFMSMSAPAYVSTEPNQASQWTAVIQVPVLKSSQTELCKAELLSFSHPDPRKNKLSKPTTTFTRDQDGNGEYRSGSLRMDWLPTDSHVDMQGRPYLAKIRAYVDVKKNACQGNLLGFWKETLDMEIPAYVIKGTPDAAKKDQLITFNGSFSVKDSVSYDIKPELMIGATLSGGVLRTANLSAKADLSFSNKLTITANGAATLDQRLPLLKEKRFIKVFLASGVPIVVSGKFKIDAQINGTVNGKMALNKSLDLKFPNTEFGLKYYRGAWHTVGKTLPDYQLKISGEADAGAELTLTLIPDLQVSFYDAASGRLLVEPYLYAQADWHGQFKYQGLALEDLDYWFTDLEAGAGANMRLYAGLSIFDYNIASYPANTTIDQIDQFYLQELLPKTPLAKLPTLSATLNATPSIASPIDSRTMLIQGQADNYVAPLLNQSLITFTDWAKPTAIPAETAQLKSTGQVGNYWFTYQAPGAYIVRLVGYNNLGWYVRQVAEQIIELTDNDSDGMVDQWEARYGVSDPNADKDNDGVNNLAEFNEGTYPDQPIQTTFNLNLLKTGNGGVTVYPSTGTSCGANCYQFPSGTQVTITAIPTDGNISGIDWQGCDIPANGTDTCIVTMSSTKQISLVFQSSPTIFSLNLSKTGNGDVTVYPSTGTSCGADCYQFLSGTQVTLTAIPTDGNISGISWQGCDVPANGTDTCIVTMSSTKQIGLTFSQRFVKIANNGNALPDDAVLGNNPDDFACMKDTTTGLIWEVKTMDGGLRDREWQYTWYDPKYLPDAYDHDAYYNAYGVSWYDWANDPDHISAGVENPDHHPAYSSFNLKDKANQIFCNSNPTHCNTDSYTQAVNANGLCAATDWRLPTIDELKTLPFYVLNVLNYGYSAWSSSLPSINPNGFEVYAVFGAHDSVTRNYSMQGIRLVRKD
ncbi:MAG: DUF1566 domain-containing protein [Methylovulum sp.]|nr:DUF1566 domain-containing protein [Methylovulum sp.]